MTPATDPDVLERSLRQGLGWLIAHAKAPEIMGLIDDRKGTILSRFPADEREFVAMDWPICVRAVAACLPDVIEALLDGLPPDLTDRIAERCLPTPTATPSASSSPASPDSMPPAS